MIKWFTTLFKMVRKYEEYQTKISDMEKELTKLHANQTELNRKMIITTKEVETARQVIVDRTSIDIDASIVEANMIIAVGRYRNGDYVEVFSFGKPTRERENTFTNMVDRLREMQKFGELDRVDAPPQFRAFVNHDLKARKL